MHNFTAAHVAQEFREVKAVILKVCGLVDCAAAKTTVGETLHSDEVWINAAQQLDRGGYQNALSIVSEFIIYPHSVQLAHPRFGIWVQE